MTLPFPSTHPGPWVAAAMIASVLPRTSRASRPMKPCRVARSLDFSPNIMRPHMERTGPWTALCCEKG